MEELLEAVKQFKRAYAEFEENNGSILFLKYVNEATEALQRAALAYEGQ